MKVLSAPQFEPLVTRARRTVLVHKQNEDESTDCEIRLQQPATPVPAPLLGVSNPVVWTKSSYTEGTEKTIKTSDQFWPSTTYHILPLLPSLQEVDKPLLVEDFMVFPNCRRGCG